MNKNLQYILIVGLILSKTSALASATRLDSLRSLIRTDRPDTTKALHYNRIAIEFRNVGVHDSAVYFANASLKLFTELFNSNTNSIVKKTAQIGMANACNTLGIIYYNQGIYPRALEYDLKGLQIDHLILGGAKTPTEIKAAKIGMGKRLGNTGNVYYSQSNFPKALDYYLQALALAEEIDSKVLIANWNGNIGNVYKDQGDYAKALNFYQKALRMEESLKNTTGITRYYGSIADVYYYQKEYEKSLTYYLLALKMAKELGNLNYTGYWLGNLGSLYTATKRYAEAEKCLKESIRLMQESGELNTERIFEEEISKLYAQTNRYPLALAHYKRSITLKDSISNDENTKKQTQLEMQYEFDKQQAADSIKNAEQVIQEGLRHAQKIKQQKLYSWGGGIGFFLMLVVAGVSFRAFKQKKKDNHTITLQKNLVEEKQKEILDSIHYAKRIQQSLLPTEKFITKSIERMTRYE